MSLEDEVAFSHDQLRLSLLTNLVAHQAGAYPGFCSMKQLGILLHPLDGMLVHRRATPSVKFVVPIYTPG